jgi:DNA-binding MurR/RpiR family transcriptional regulator
MKNERLSLLYNLLHILNKNQVGSADYQLAAYFLNNYAKMSVINIYDASAANNVSRATIRRFANRLGYKNFLEMKEHFSDFNEGTEAYRTFYSGKDFRDSLRNSIDVMMREMSDHMTWNETHSLARLISESDQVSIIASMRVANSVKIFQQEMVYFGQTINLAVDQDNIAQLEQRMTSNSLTIVISITGVFLQSVSKQIQSLPGTKVLVTLSRNPTYNRWFDKVIHLNSHDFDLQGQFIYYSYGINYLMDILFKDYLEYIQKGDN